MPGLEATKEKKTNHVEIHGEPDTEKTGSGFWKRESEMLKFKALYFLAFAYAGSINPYIPFIARDGIGLSATSFSTVILLQKIVTLVVKPSLGYIADYFKKIKAMIILLILLGIGCNFLLSVIPKVERFKNPSNKGTLVFKSFSEYCNLTCNAKRSKLNESITFVDMKECALKMESCGMLLDSCVFNCGGIIRCKTSRTQKSFRNISECIPSVSNNESGSVGDNIANNAQLFDIRESFVNSCCCQVLSTNAILAKGENISEHNISASANHTICVDVCMSFDSSSCELNVSDCSCWFVGGEQSDVPNVSDFQTYQFYAFAFLSVAAMLTIDCVGTLIDTACVEQAKATDHDFGRQAVWGSVGFAAVSLPLGYTVGSSGSYAAVYATMTACGLATAATAGFVRYVRPRPSPSILSDFAEVARAEDFLFFAVGAFMNGVAYGAVVMHGLWYLQSVGADGWVIGLSLTETQLGKAAFFFMSGRILARLGHHHVTTVAMLSFVARCLTYCYLDDPYWVLAVEWMHGATALYYHCVVDFAKSCAKPGTENLVQMVVSVLYLCGGVAFGTFVAGLGFDYIGGRETYFIFGVSFGAFAIVNLVYTQSLKKRKQNKLEISDSADNDKY